MVERRRWVLAGLMMLAAACSSAKSIPGDTSCADLPSAYTTALAAASTCNPAGGTGQCQVLSSPAIPCNCPTYVNDTTVLDSLNAQWRAKGCALPPGTGCVTGCRQDSPRVCVAVDGGGVCQEPGP
jgi:hypothetical protein